MNRLQKVKTASVVGSLPFMAPEASQGQRKEGDPVGRRVGSGGLNRATVGKCILSYSELQSETVFLNSPTH